MGWIIAGLLALIIVALAALLWSQRNEIFYLRSRLDARWDHEHRIERMEAGLPEVKMPEPRSDTPPPGIAAAIEDVLGAWDSQATMDQKRADIRGWRQDGQPWEWILHELQSEVLGGE